MIVVRNKLDLNFHIAKFKKNNKQIGFVPTMGALHDGHISLIKCSKQKDDIVVCSIFVNPTQFNNNEDLIKYPREEKEDIEKLKKAECNIVFIPSVSEMYPEEDKRVFDFDGIDKVMEGKFRNGHFNGVAQIVSKLFSFVKPDTAYFGRKDFQQVAILKHLNENYLKHLNIEIIACDILREDDGLAMSSRNKLLTPEHRKAAPLIQKVLKKYKTRYEDFTVKELMKLIEGEINKNKFLNVEYIDIVNNNNLKTVSEIVEGETTTCIAVFAGNVRLIDNISF